jgi:hypothetical protein
MAKYGHLRIIAQPSADTGTRNCLSTAKIMVHPIDGQSRQTSCFFSAAGYSIPATSNLGKPQPNDFFALDAFIAKREWEPAVRGSTDNFCNVFLSSGVTRTGKRLVGGRLHGLSRCGRTFCCLIRLSVDWSSSKNKRRMGSKGSGRILGEKNELAPYTCSSSERGGEI